MSAHQERLRRLGAAAKASDDLAANDREARDAEIEQADADGLSTREISKAVGMSASRIHAIVLKRTAARQARLARAAGL
jgi:transposase